MRYTTTFAGAAAGPGFEVPSSGADLWLEGGANGATIKWQVSYDRYAAADDNAATWRDATKDADGTVASYVLGPNASIALPMISRASGSPIWVRPVCTAYTAGSPKAGAE